MVAGVADEDASAAALGHHRGNPDLVVLPHRGAGSLLPIHIDSGQSRLARATVGGGQQVVAVVVLNEQRMPHRDEGVVARTLAVSKDGNFAYFALAFGQLR